MTDTFEIRLKIEDEADLYNPFDEERMTINSDVMEYLFGKYKEKGIREKLSICIVSDKDIDMEHLKKTFGRYMDVQRMQLKKEKKANNIKQIWMFAVGVIFISFGIYASMNLPQLLGEVVSTIGAFAMWEAASIWIVENPKNRIKQRWLRSLEQTGLTNERK